MGKKLFSILIGLFCLLDISRAAAMSLNVENAEIGGVLRSIARMGGINLILDESVVGMISLKLDEAEPVEILHNAIKARGLGVTKDGNIWVVADRARLQNGFAKVYILPVKYAPLEDIKMAAELYMLGTSKTGTNANTSQKKNAKDDSKSSGDKSLAHSNDVAQTKAGRVMTDISTGSLLVLGTAEEAEAIKALVQRLDVPAKQISIEAKVVSVAKEDASKLGVAWEWSNLPQYNYNGDSVNRPQFATSGTAGGIVSFGKGPNGKPYEWQYAATLEALVTDGKAEVLSRPNITTLQGQEAIINIGASVPVPQVSTTNSTVTTSIEYKDTGIILRCLPMVNEDGYITSRIHTEVSAPKYVEEMSAYSFQKRSADTMVRLKNGETMVIGGLISSEEIRSMSKIPFLGDLPILGNLFKSVHKSKNNTELFIILKAEIVE